jgi:trimeric autotransporter adhesin
MAAKFNREDVSLGAIPVGKVVESTTTTPAPTGLPNRAIDWGVLASGGATNSGSVLTVQSDGSIGWAPAGSGSLTNPMSHAGDSIYGGAAGVPTALAIGTATQVLTVNAGATAPVWAAAPTGLTVGNTVGSAVHNAILYCNGSGVLAASSGLTFSGGFITSTGYTNPGSYAGSEAFGNSASCSAVNGTAIGNSAAAASNATAIGVSSSAGDHAVAEGVSATASGAYSVAVGSAAAASASNAVAIGRQAAASGNPSFAVGYQATAGAGQAVIGGIYANFTSFAICGSSAGTSLLLQGESAGTLERSCGIISGTFNVNADATWSGNLLLYAGDHTSTNTGQRLGVQVQSNGSAALLGFFGQTPVVQPATGAGSTTMGGSGGSAVSSGNTFTGGGTAAYTIDDLVHALKALGLLAP